MCSGNVNFRVRLGFGLGWEMLHNLSEPYFPLLQNGDKDINPVMVLGISK